MVNIKSRYCFVSKDPSYFVMRMQVLPEVEQLWTLTMILCVRKCGRRTRAFKVQRGGSCLLLSFQCNHLPQCLRDHTISGLLIAKPLLRYVEVGSMKLGLHKMARSIFDICNRSPVKLWFSIKLIATEFFSTPFNCWMAL